jgi:hypothetical protein
MMLTSQRLSLTLAPVNAAAGGKGKAGHTQESFLVNFLISKEKDVELHGSSNFFPCYGSDAGPHTY